MNTAAEPNTADLNRVELNIAELIRSRLAAFSAEHLELLDESARHVGHAGAASGGGHYCLRIVSSQFAGLGRLARHRLIYEALGPLMHKDIHALSITALTPDETNQLSREQLYSAGNVG